MRNQFWRGLFSLLVLAAFLAGCAQDAAEAQPVGATAAADGYDYAAEDLDASWDEQTSTAVRFSGGGIETDGAGASVTGSTVTISAAGTYVLSGESDDAQVVVDAGGQALVRLVLNGVDIASKTGAPVASLQADKTVVILAAGTSNTLADAQSYSYADADTAPDAALFAQDDLTITGGGSLTVYGSYNDGIGSKDYLCVTGGTIEVHAASDGLQGRDGVAVKAGTLAIEAGADGVKSNNDEDAAKGFVVLDGGDFSITAGHDGVQAQTALAIAGGTFEVHTGSGAGTAAQTQAGFPSDGMTPPDGGMRQPDAAGFVETAAVQDTAQTVQADATADESDSYKGLKAGVSIAITGGTFTIDAQDDAVHANGDITVSGGTFDIATGDDGFHADAALTLLGGTIRIAQCYEGLEGLTVDISGGEIDVVSSDDGINAAGGSDGEAQGPMGADQFAVNGDAYIRITGGSVHIDASGDGIDSNGATWMEGGTLTIDGPVSGADGALDTNGEMLINGGTTVAVGNSAMLEPPDEASGQPCFVVYYTQTQQAGVSIRLTDASGAQVLEYTPSKSYQSAVISLPAFAQGDTFTLYSGDTELAELTLSETVTRVSSDGTASAGGMQGGFGGGAMPGAAPDGNAVPDGGFGRDQAAQPPQMNGQGRP